MKSKRLVGLFLLAGTVIVLDQWTKWLVSTRLELGEAWLPAGLTWLMPWARIIHWFNTGSAFGLFQGKGVLFTGLALLVALMIIYYYPQVEAEDWQLRLALGLQMGGALGNMIDRLRLGHVTDFISVGNFPLFNVADSAITLGVVFMLWSWYVQEKRMRELSAAAGVDAPVAVQTEDTLDE